jgi:membrane protein YdbS with pleckstrin-like domain
MYDALKAVLLPVLKLPTTPPDPPTGHAPGEFLKTIQAAPNYLHYRIFQWVLGVSILVIAELIGIVVALVTFPLGGLILAVPLVLIGVVKAALFYVTARLDYEMRWYVLTERSLRVREGIWIVRELTLTFANVQNVQVLQGPVQRFFGFSDVLVETAGGGSKQKENKLVDSHRAVLRGITNPAEVRDLILNLVRRYRTAGLGDHEETRLGAKGKGTGVDNISKELLVEIRDAARSLRDAVAQKA